MGSGGLGARTTRRGGCGTFALLLSLPVLVCGLSLPTSAHSAPLSVNIDGPLNQHVDYGTRVTLSGSATGGSGTKRYSWTQTEGLTAVTLINANRASASFTAPKQSEDEWLGFQLTVTDASGTATSETTYVNVFGTGSVLSANAGPDRTVGIGHTVTLSGRSWGRGGTKTYAWTQTAGSPTVTIDNADRASAGFTAPSVASNTVLEFTLTVTAQSSTAGTSNATDKVRITVSPSPLSVGAYTASNRVDSGAPVTLNGTVSGGSGTLTYAWVQTYGKTVTLDGSNRLNASFTAPVVTSHWLWLGFRLTVTSADGQSDAATVWLRVMPAIPLSATAWADQTVTAGSSVTLSGRVIGGIGAKTYAWTQTGGSPAVTIDDADQVSASFTAPSVTASTPLEFTLTATAGSETDTDTVSVTVKPAPLSVEAGADQAVDSRAPVALAGTVTGGDGPRTYAWTQTGGSPTVTIDNVNQASASFTAPSVTEATELEFTLTVAAGSETAADTVTVTVAAEPPRVAGLSLVSRPQSGDTYGPGETVRAQVWLTGLVAVSGSPRLALGIGTQTRTMSYVGLERTQVLEFEYAVQASDADADGVSIGGSALSLPSGTTLTGEIGGTVGLSLSEHAIANASEHKVDGSQTAGSLLPDLNACPED